MINSLCRHQQPNQQQAEQSQQQQSKQVLKQSSDAAVKQQGVRPPVNKPEEVVGKCDTHQQLQHVWSGVD